MESVILQKDFHKWKTFTADLPWSGRILRETTKNQTLQATVSMLNAKVGASRTRKRQNKYGLCCKVAGQSVFVLMAAQLRFAKQQLDKPQDFWISVFWKDQTKVDMFGQNAQERKHLITAAKHIGGGLMSHSVAQKLLWIAKYSGVKRESICLAATA